MANVNGFSLNIALCLVFLMKRNTCQLCSSMIPMIFIALNLSIGL